MTSTLFGYPLICSLDMGEDQLSIVSALEFDGDGKVVLNTDTVLKLINAHYVATRPDIP